MKRKRWTENHRPSDLTPREAEVWRLKLSGLATAQIADQLGVLPVTVHNHMTEIRFKAKLAIHPVRHVPGNVDPLGKRWFAAYVAEVFEILEAGRAAERQAAA